MVLAQEQKYRSMEQDRKPRYKPTHLWSPNLMTNIYDKNIQWKNTVSSISGAGKTGQLQVKNETWALPNSMLLLSQCPTLCDPTDCSPPDSRPWDSPGKNIGVGCHFLLQCMKMKSESEVTQSCPTLWDPMDCSLPDSSVHGIFQARVLEWIAVAFSTLIP